jgi:hypothetical protein
MAQVDGIRGLGMVSGAQCHGSRRTTLLQSREWRRGLEDGACEVNSVTDSGRGRWRHVKGLDRGRGRRCGGSGEDSTTARRLLGELNDGIGSKEGDDGACSRENFGGKFWQSDGVSESLQGLVFFQRPCNSLFIGKS